MGADSINAFIGDTHLSIVPIPPCIPRRPLPKSQMHTVSPKKLNKRQRKSSSVSITQKCVLFDNYFESNDGISSEIVPNQYHQSLPDNIENFAIFFFYNLRQASIANFHQLYLKMYTLCTQKQKQSAIARKIFINFKNGLVVIDTNVTSDPLPNKEMMNLLKRCYEQWNQKCLPYEVEPTVGGETDEDDFWFPVEGYPDYPVANPIIKKEETLCDSFKLNMAMISGAFVVAATFGFKIAKRGNLGFNQSCL